MTIQQRRSFLKKSGIVLSSLFLSFSKSLAAFSGHKKNEFNQAPVFKDNLSQTNDRVWIGEDYWAIPMEDWSVKKGRIECVGTEKFSRVTILTAVINQGTGDLVISSDMGLNKKSATGKGGSTGFAIGLKDDVDMDAKSVCYFGKGLHAGISTKGSIFIGNQSAPIPENFNYADFKLSVKGEKNGGITELILTCTSYTANASVSHKTENDISGMVALVNNFDEGGSDTFWFKNISLTGSKISVRKDNSFGPVLWSMYTLSKGALNMVAQMPPVGAGDTQEVHLFLKTGNQWKKAAAATIDKAAYTAHFHLQDWKQAVDMPYQLRYTNGKAHVYDGMIRKEPVNRPLKFGGLTCQMFMAYPYKPLIDNLQKHDPDILYFSGDQLYEQNGGYPIKRQPEQKAILSYLGKWYMFGWAFGKVMRNRPTICTPDDHDVFQGNLWGEGGKGNSFEEWEKVRDAHGGYVQTPAMVNVVGLTQCGHMPAPYHAEDLASGIKPWYTDLLYGKVSFAIISDRMFKSGPDVVRKGTGRLDHIKEPVNENALEDASLEMLGTRQMQFLEHWVNEWEGANMKVLLSQTLFANVGTHHGDDKMFLYGDMDSGGWPKQKRDEALRLIRKAAAFHINGDQHLPFIVQYSLDEKRDAGWTFCTPAISTGYIRWGQPDSVKAPYTDRPKHGLPNTGCYKDVFGNTNYVYAVGNPMDEYQHMNRYIRAQNKASGFGIITFDTNRRTIKMDAYRFLADKDKPTTNDQFPGWPLTISQMDNDGRKPVAFLPVLKINKPDQVVKIVHDKDQSVVSAIRIKGTTYEPAVYADGKYTIYVGEGTAVKELKGLEGGAKGTKAAVKIFV